MMGHATTAQRLQGSSPVQDTWDIRAVSGPEEALLETLEEKEAVLGVPLVKMERRPWYLVFTVSESEDFKEQNGRHLGSRGEVRLESRGDEYLDLRGDDGTAGNVRAVMDLQGDGRKWTLMSVKERTERWSPPPDRESKLEVVRSGSTYDVRAYKGEKKPSRLFEEEEDEDLRYQVPPGDVTLEKTRSLEEQRQEIVRGQVVKKSHTVAERWSSQEELENINAAAASRGTYPAEFAISFDSPPSGWVSTPVDPDSIDTEQINFAAARQQFLMLEKANPKLLLGSQKQTPPARAQVTQNARGRREWDTPLAASDDRNQVGPGGLQEKTYLPNNQRKGPVSHSRVEVHQSSSGWNMEPSSEHVFTIIPREERPGSPLPSTGGVGDPATLPEDRDETPIEREIRLAQEREEDLWKERGMRRTNSRDELVEIPSVPVLSTNSFSPASSRSVRDMRRISFSVQREIEQEIKREEDLQREGRLLGTYHKGTQQGLAERRKVFEQDQETEVPEPSLQKWRGLGEQGWLLEDEPRPAHGSFATENRGSPMSWRPEAFQVPPSPAATKQMSGNEWSTSRPSYPLSSGLQKDPPRSPYTTFPQPPDAGQRLVLQKEHFTVPVQKLKFSSSSDTRRQEPGPQWEAPRGELYTLKSWKPRTSVLIDQEIQEALQREMELQEQREEARRRAEVVPGSRVSSQSSAVSGVAGSYSLPTSPVFLPDGLARGSPSPSAEHVYARRVLLESDAKTLSQGHMSPPVEEEKWKRPREGGKYAGIELYDEIDNEVVKSTKVVRQRGVLAQLWETGQIHRIYEDSD